MGANVKGKPTREITESQRALELRKFFAPYLSQSQVCKEPSFNESLNNDGALSAYAETIVWRLRAVHCMVSLIDRTEQYFVAGATRSASSEGDDIEESACWFGCETVPTPGGLCENTVTLDRTADPYPCFIVNDLSHDERFASLPVVNGSVAAYRFYAGTPITTSQGINIGSFFIFDDKPRVGLTLKQKKYLHGTAEKVMRHLESKREAAERRRVALMSQGIAKFLERTGDAISSELSILDHDGIQKIPPASPKVIPVDVHLTSANISDVASKQSQGGDDTTLDKIRLTLNHAADVLRESLELTAGGVVFLDAAISYSDIGDFTYANNEDTGRGSSVKDGRGMRSLRPPGDNAVIQSSDDLQKSTKVLAISAAPTATWDHRSRVLDAKTLNMLINSYPKGNIWYIDDEGYFSSLEQYKELAISAAVSPSGRRRSVPIIDVTYKQKAEATMLSRIFYKARQIMFLPLWDAGGERWHSGCFVWSRSAVPVWSVESEVAYLSAFTNSVMVEMSRLDAITSNKMKSDFISSISHEFRSPLHGILASAEFLRDSILDTSQVEFVSTIQNCSGTLLDTINHVLDYSKINSFDKVGAQQGNISNELYQVTNLALLCEDLITGMIAAGEFRSAGSIDPSIPISYDIERDPLTSTHPHPYSAVEIILDIEGDDWVYKVQAGALRRVIMNIFGNAQKYTDSGSILVEVRMRKAEQNARSKNMPIDELLIHVRDTGRGMSSEYMERKLYHPFAQEDSFAPGIGLGLSIVRSIINQLGGQIQIRSELGKGTDVKITLPCDKPDGSEISSQPDDLTKLSAGAQEAVISLRKYAAGKTLLIDRQRPDNVRSLDRDISWSCVEKYCSEWFGYKVITSREVSNTVDLVITNREEDSKNITSVNEQRTLVVQERMVSQHQKKNRRLIGSICTPIGPFKLARSILSLLKQEFHAIPTCSTSDQGTQTPLASPEVQLSNGSLMTDYGFTDPVIGPSTEILDPTEEPASQAQEESAKQAIASLGALSLRMPPHPKRTPTASPVTENPDTLVTNSTTPASLPVLSSDALHILAVDDNALNLQLIHRYLLKRKMDTIITARNGVEAVTTVREEANKGMKFDVIFMDISMPEMDGFEATRLIRGFERSFAHRSILEDAGPYSTGDSDGKGVEVTDIAPGARTVGWERKRAYIVALTGLASRRDRDEAELCGFDDFLTKPIAFGKIGDLLNKLSKEKGSI